MWCYQVHNILHSDLVLIALRALCNKAADALAEWSFIKTNDNDDHDDDDDYDHKFFLIIKLCKIDF